MKKSIEKICVSAVMVALSSVLSLVKIPVGPLGGSITLLSMVPVSLISIWYGIGFSVLPCLLYSIIQMFLDGFLAWGLTPAVLIGSMIFDYLFAFGFLSLSGIFKNKKSGRTAGVLLCCFLRFICHFISGIIFFKSYEILKSPAIYSIVYNGSYMLPELILTSGCVFIFDKSGLIDRVIKKR